jgi:hypothetical protein
MVMMKNKPKASVVVVGMLSGALITAALAAFDLWIFTYTDSRSGFLGYYSNFAPVAAIVGGVGGLVAGALLGFFLRNDVAGETRTIQTRQNPLLSISE